MDKKKIRKNALQWAVLLVLMAAVSFSAISVIPQGFWKWFASILGAAFLVFSISEFIKYYKLGKALRR